MIKAIISDNEKSAGEVIRGLRVENNLTMKQLAKRAGVSESGVSRWENGGRIPNVEVFIKLIKALDADVVIIRKPTREG